MTGHLDAFGLLVLLPDMMRLNVWSALAERLGPLQVEICAVTPLILQPHQVERLCGGPSGAPPHNEGRARAAAHRLARLDACIVVVLRGKLPGLPLSRTIARWRGSPRLEQLSPGDLLGISSLASHACPLVYAPASVTDLEFDLDELLTPAVASSVVKDPADRRLDWVDLQRLRSFTTPERERGPLGLLPRVALRMATLLKIDCLLAPASELDALTEHLASVVREQERVSAPTVHGVAHVLDGMNACRELLEPVKTPQARGVMNEGLPGIALSRTLAARRALLAMLTRLAQPQQCTLGEGPLLTQVLRDNGLFLDPWEAHLIQASLEIVGKSG